MGPHADAGYHRETGYYEELGVPPTASTAEIRAAYLRLARTHHPDRLGDAPEAERARSAGRMARINAAWSVLSDGARRARYDAVREGVDPATGAPDGSSRVRDVDPGFSPLDEHDEPFDPMLLDDTPLGAPTLHRSLAFVPVGLGAAGAACILFGALLGFMGLFTFGFVLIAASGLSFLAIPLLALVRSSRADRGR